MKLRYFSLIPILLVSGCTNTNELQPHKSGEKDIYYNVHYYFSYASHSYIIFSDSGYENKIGECPICNFYYIYALSSDMPRIDNEYYVKTQELFVYDHK